MTLRLARSSVEAHLYMQTTACQTCGETDFEPDSSVISIEGELASRFVGACQRCSTMREFTFLLPEEILFPDDENPEFGDERPSELLDPGDWLWLADLFAGEAPAQPDGLDDQQRRGALVDLRTAAAAIGEVLKFLPSGAEEIPASRFFSERGRSVYAQEPGRFVRGRLEVVQSTYREISDRFVTDRPVTPPPDTSPRRGRT